MDSNRLEFYKTCIEGVDKKKIGGSIEGNLSGWSDQKFLTGQVMVGSQLPELLLFSKRFIFVLNKSYPLVSSEHVYAD